MFPCFRKSLGTLSLQGDAECGSGKSFGVTVFLLNLTYEKGHKVLFTRYTLISAN